MIPILRLLIPLCFALSVVAAEPQKPSADPIPDAAIRDLLVKGLDAVSPKELDAPLAELAQRREHLPADYGLQPANSSLLRETQEILIAYQDGLLGITTRNYNSPTERLQQVANSHSITLASLLPRSEFLLKIQAACARLPGEDKQAPGDSVAALEAQLGELIRSVKKIEDMDAVLPKVEALAARERQITGAVGRNDPAFLFRNYCFTYHAMLAGNATYLELPTSQNAAAGSEIMPNIRNLVIRFALPRILGTPADLIPGENETTVGFLKRAMAKAQATSDWPLLSRVLNTALDLGFTNLVSHEDSIGLFNFLGGINQEEAHFRSGAVSSYLAALKGGSLAVPAEYIGKRLAEIRQQDPEGFEKGVKNVPNASMILDRQMGRSLYQRGFPRVNTVMIPALPSPAPEKPSH